MNRILFEPAEICEGIATIGDDRARHIIEVLHGEPGQILKTGEVNGKIGISEIVAIENGCVRARVDHREESIRPWVDIILAPPRPRVLKRLLPQLAAMGAGKIVLVGAKKVEKDFWGATLLREETYRSLLIEGLMQAGTSILPEIVIRRGLRNFLQDEFEGMFHGSRRIIAHPYAAQTGVTAAKMGQQASCPDDRLLLAIGPEGGWTDEEVQSFEDKGFLRYSLGRRILRTDTATIALLAKLNKENG